MISLAIRRYLPRSLFGRALLILVLPILLIQFTVGGIFADRIFNEMTSIMSQNFSRVINQMTRDFSSAEQQDLIALQNKADDLGLSIREVSIFSADMKNERQFFDLTAIYVERNLSSLVEGYQAISLESLSPYDVTLWVERDGRLMELTFSRRFVSARNPHQLPLIMVFTSILLTGVAVFFLRNQITPIRKLADAAEAFGQGRSINLRPRGATEVRSAAAAFLGMRKRIERHIDQRTLMLSGVSHDLRTPLTRLKLGISMLGDKEDTEALLNDIADMEAIIGEFLSFAGEDQDESWSSVSPSQVLSDVKERMNRSHPDFPISLFDKTALDLKLYWRPTAIRRAFENILENASKYGSSVRISAEVIGGQLSVTFEDNGPGIIDDDRNNALNAFVRLDESRNQNKGAGVGLGLAITHDIVKAHGGHLALEESRELGGLMVRISLPLTR
ncbi:MAG: ATP-binding protein [Pseudomonadota bacterium]